MSNQNQSQHDRTHRSFFFPTLLILIGIFFLLVNLGYLSGNIWSIVVRFWPVLFLIGAVEDLLNAKWVSAVFNAGIGSVLLLANMGYFPWTTWEMIFRLWPIFLIAIGLDIVFRDQSIFGSLIGVSIAVLVIGALVWFGLQSPLVGEGQVFSLEQKIGKINQGDVKINPAVADLSIDAHEDISQFYAGSISIAEKEQLTDDYFEEDGIGRLYLSSNGTVILPSKSKQDGFLWDIGLTNTIPLTLEIDQGIGQQNLDLESLLIKSFDSDLGIGKMVITLPNTDQFSGTLNCGIGEMIIYVPENVSVEFVLDTAITAIDYPDDFYKNGDVIRSQEAKNGSVENSIYLELPIGALKIIEN